MKTDTPQTVYLKDYTPPAFLVDTVDLDFVIETGSTTVTATLAMRRNPASPPSRWCSMAMNWKRCRLRSTAKKCRFPKRRRR